MVGLFQLGEHPWTGYIILRSSRAHASFLRVPPPVGAVSANFDAFACVISVGEWDLARDQIAPDLKIISKAHRTLKRLVGEQLPYQGDVVVIGDRSVHENFYRK